MRKNRGWHEHPNGGGLVQNTAFVDESVYVGPDATVSANAKVSDHVRVEDRARVFGYARVYDNVRLTGNAWVGGRAWVYGDAALSGNVWIEDHARIGPGALISSHDDVIWGSVVGYKTTAYRTKSGIKLRFAALDFALDEWRDDLDEICRVCRPVDLARFKEDTGTWVDTVSELLRETRKCVSPEGWDRDKLMVEINRRMGKVKELEAAIDKYDVEIEKLWHWAGKDNDG